MIIVLGDYVYETTDEEEAHGINCICESCLQTYPERGIIAGLYDMHGEPYDEEPPDDSRTEQ